MPEPADTDSKPAEIVFPANSLLPVPPYPMVAPLGLEESLVSPDLGFPVGGGLSSQPQIPYNQEPAPFDTNILTNIHRPAVAKLYPTIDR